jgi:hypothetical protein
MDLTPTEQMIMDYLEAIKADIQDIKAELLIPAAVIPVLPGTGQSEGPTATPPAVYRDPKEVWAGLIASPVGTRVDVPGCGYLLRVDVFGEIQRGVYGSIPALQWHWEKIKGGPEHLFADADLRVLHRPYGKMLDALMADCAPRWWDTYDVDSTGKSSDGTGAPGTLLCKYRQLNGLNKD